MKTHKEKVCADRTFNKVPFSRQYRQSEWSGVAIGRACGRRLSLIEQICVQAPSSLSQKGIGILKVLTEHDRKMLREKFEAVELSDHVRGCPQSPVSERRENV